MNYLGQLNQFKYTCPSCACTLTVIEINIETYSDKIFIYPIFCCPECNSCYEDKFNTDLSYQISASGNKEIQTYDLQRVVFSSPLTSTEANTIDQALCDYGSSFEMQIKNSLDTIHSDLRAEMSAIETNLLEIINRNHEDVVADLRRRVNSFHLE